MKKSILIFILALSAAAFAKQVKKADKIDKNEKEKKLTITRGSIVYNTYCVLCHGEKGYGDGRLAINKLPPPANLTTSILTDAQKEEIIRKGGEGVGRSPFMPPWGEELSDEQIKDLIVYLRTIVSTP